MQQGMDSGRRGSSITSDPPRRGHSERGGRAGPRTLGLARPESPTVGTAAPGVNVAQAARVTKKAAPICPHEPMRATAAALEACIRDGPPSLREIARKAGVGMPAGRSSRHLKSRPKSDPRRETRKCFCRLLLWRDFTPKESLGIRRRCG